MIPIVLFISVVLKRLNTTALDDFQTYTQHLLHYLHMLCDILTLVQCP